MSTLLEQMQAHPDIRVRETIPGVFSCNFTREAFYGGNWHSLTTAARGLFLDKDSHVVARGYEKFFGINEHLGVDYATYREKAVYPIRAAIKENGFLGIIANVDGALTVFSKSGVTDYSRHAQMMLSEALSDEAQEQLATFLKNSSTSLAVEIIDPFADPHIVRETQRRISVLDLVSNSEEFQLYEVPVEIGQLGKPNSEVEWKMVDAETIHTPDELDALYAHARNADLEGYVLTDASGKMTKLKSQHYQEVKALRSGLNRAWRNGGVTGDKAVMEIITQLKVKGLTLNDFERPNVVGSLVLDIPSLMHALTN